MIDILSQIQDWTETDFAGREKSVSDAAAWAVHTLAIYKNTHIESSRMINFLTGQNDSLRKINEDLGKAIADLRDGKQMAEGKAEKRINEEMRKQKEILRENEKSASRAIELVRRMTLIAKIISEAAKNRSLMVSAEDLRLIALAADGGKEIKDSDLPPVVVHEGRKRKNAGKTK
jgi:hypothetical protein